MTIHRGEPVRSEFRTHRAAVTMTVTSGQRQQQRRFPVLSITPHPDAWALALILGDGDVSRLRALPGGAVLIRNRGR